MSQSPELHDGIGLASSHGSNENDAASRWKRLMTSQCPPNEHVYLAPSLTRTPTPPMLLDRSKDASSSMPNGTVLKPSHESFPASNTLNSDDISVNSDVRN